MTPRSKVILDYLESDKTEIAESMITEKNSWTCNESEPLPYTYTCNSCDLEIIGYDECINHVLEEHDDELEPRKVIV